MGRGPQSQEAKRLKALEAAAKFLGQTVEEIKVDVPVETQEDKLSEASAVILYHETKGVGFQTKVCKHCQEPFAYIWDRTAISFCSVTCADRDLKKIGLSWNPNRPARERWGRTAPLVVPPQALKLLTESLNESEEVPVSDTA